MRNGISISLRHNPTESFRDLAPSEQSSLDSIDLATESFCEVFTECQSQPDGWSLSYRFMSECHLLCSSSDWEAHVMTCGYILQAARDTIVNKGIHRTYDELKAWFAGPMSPCRTWQLTALSDHAPAFDHLISDPRVIAWSQRLLETMRHHFQETLTVEASSSLPPSPATIELLDARHAMAIDQAKADAKEEAQRTYHATLRTDKLLPWKRPTATSSSGNPPLSCLSFRQRKPRLELQHTKSSLPSDMP